MDTPYVMFEVAEAAAEEFSHRVSDLEDMRSELARLEPLSAAEGDALASYDADWLVRFTYNSAAIEGSTLTLADTALVLEGEFVPSGDKRLSDIFAAKGIADATEYAAAALARGRALGEELVKDVHERLALDSQPRARGSYRTTPVFIVGSLTTPPSASRVREGMADLMFVMSNSRLPAPLRASAFHAAFEAIHPFAEGNGRTGRVLLNYALAQGGWPSVAIKADMRDRYVTALEDWQVRGEPRPLVESVCDSLEAELATRIGIVAEARAQGLPVMCRPGADELVSDALAAGGAHQLTMRPGPSRNHHGL